MKLLNRIGLQVALALTEKPELKREEGQTLVEYALIIVTIALVVVAGMAFLAGKLNSLFTSIGNQL